MIRVNVVAEGKTELRFVKDVLNQYFAGLLVLDARCVLTSTDTKLNFEYRGGLTSYAKAKHDIVTWLKADSHAYVSTMFDFFRLPNDFPGYDVALRCTDHARAVEMLEDSLQRDVEAQLPQAKERFIPYIQLHEFEALLFTDIRVLKYDYLGADEKSSIDRLYQDTSNIPPEDINHDPETAPSKRLLKALDYRKGDAPAEWIEEITIAAIREKCPHFSNWIKKLQDLAE